MKSLIAAILLVLALGTLAVAQDGPDASLAVTANEPEISTGGLSMVLMSLTRSELENELLAWQGMLQTTVAALGTTQRELGKIAEARAAEEAGQPLDPNTVPGGLPDPAAEDLLAETADNLLGRRAALLERFEVIIDEYERKGGDPTEFRLYAQAVSGVRVDFSNFPAAYETARRWLLSEEGGQRVAINVGIFLLVAIAAWFLGKLVSWVLGAGLAITGAGSRLLRRFIAKWSGRIVFAFGLLYGLAQLGVNITPLVAAIGATGFVIGFALQNTLSNFASGLLIMTQRPFDVGDVIDAAGVNGTVDRVTLFSTHISTFDNSKLTVPNNSIWSSVITNSTASDRKRLSLTFEIKPPFTVDQAEKILMEIVSSNRKVLAEPAPIVRMDALTDEGFELICWPWVKTSDASEVRWDIIRAVRQRLRGEVQEEEDKTAAQGEAA